jgi:ATP-dependent helicase/nuclease subunit B
MLKILQYHLRSDLKPIVDSFDDSSCTWIVSNLKSKNEIQKVLIEKNKFFFESSCLRISELWNQIIKVNYPVIKVWPQSIYKLFLRKNLVDYKNEFQINENSFDTLLRYIQQLSPLLFHPNRNDLIKDFFIKNEASFERWHHWYLSALTMHLIMFEDKKVILQEQIPSFLQTQLNYISLSNKKFIFDLGTEVTQIEMDLIKSISQNSEVIILQPLINIGDEFKFLNRPYERVQSYANSIIELDTNLNFIKQSVQFATTTSFLAEFKAIVGEIRKLVLAGCEFSKIGVVANKIEIYWPVLQIHLQEENIPFNKDIVIRAQSIIGIQDWLNKLKIAEKDLTSEVLENEIFRGEKLTTVSYDKFKKLFGIFYDASDLDKDSSIADLFKSDVSHQELIPLDSFVIQALKYWIHEDQSEIIIPVLKKMMDLTQFKEKLLWSDWLNLLSDLISQKEITLQSASEKGIQICNLSSAQAYTCKYLFVLGLTDEQLKDGRRTLITADDSWLLLKDYDIEIQATEESQAEFELSWLIEKAESNLYLFAPESNFDGKILTKSSIFLKYGQNTIQNFANLPTTQMDINMNIFESGGAFENLNNEAWWDKAPQVPLSATSLQDFKKCPFIYAAERLLQLKSFDSIDIEIQSLSQGSVVHKIFETILKNFTNLKIQSEELDLLIQNAIESSSDYKYYEEFLIQMSKEKFKKLALNFIKSEEQLQKTFPNTKPLVFEKKFLFYFDPITQKFVSDHDENNNSLIRVAGSIDRIDVYDKNKIILIDYKGSSGALSSFTNWFKDENFQLLFYTWIAEELIFKDQEFEVISAVFNIYKDFSRSIGFSLESFNNIAAPSVQKAGIISVSTKEQAISDFKVIFNSVARELQKSNFRPQPKELELCKDCHWRKMCRAPHLN